MRPSSRITLAVSLLFALLAVGTAGFHFIEKWPWFQSLYGTLMTVSTIGAEPENQLSPSGRIFNVMLIFAGLGVVGFAIGTLTHAVIQSELGVFFGRRRMEKEIAKLRDHFIICGAGRVGRRVAGEVAARNLPLVIVEQDPGKAKWAQEKNYPVIVGDATNEAILRQARIEFAKGLASAVTSDAQNVYIVLTARGMAPDMPIVARASEEAAESKLLKAGATTVISPYTFAGQRMARWLTRPHVQRFIDLALSSLSDGSLDLQIEEVRVAERSKLAGRNLMEADVRQELGVIVLAIRHTDGHLEFNPGPQRQIVPGDFLIAMGDSQKLKDLEGLAGV
ncbi:MAG: potassium channel protein [Acidobacteriia bacterium]|nr:potassium channel protein [Terriglobia bacterium]